MYSIVDKEKQTTVILCIKKSLEPNTDIDLLVHELGIKSINLTITSKK
jgi:hypothetical protein